MAEKIKDGIVKEIIELNKNDKLKNKRPNLAIILIGEREDSKLYVNLKEKEAKIVGIDTHTYKCPENIKSQEVIDIINCLNKDGLIDAILVQLPLPEDLDTNAIISAIDPKKDVDRFHPENLGKLLKIITDRMDDRVLLSTMAYRPMCSLGSLLSWCGGALANDGSCSDDWFS